jgi:hypothetical protein
MVLLGSLSLVLTKNPSKVYISLQGIENDQQERKVFPRL